MRNGDLKAYYRHVVTMCFKGKSPSNHIPLCSPLRLPPSAFRPCLAFTLLEVLVAVAVLAVMMTFLFDLLGSSAKLWEIGNRKIEAAQAARIGLNIMASDLQNAFAGEMTSFTSNGTPITNIAPFLAVDDPNNTIDLEGGAVNAAGSQQLFGVLSSGDSSQPFKEFGYLCVFLNSEDGTDPMIGRRYYLVRKQATGTEDQGNFFLRPPENSPANDYLWLEEWANDSSTFIPIIDNCLRMTLEYYGEEDLEDQNDPQDTPSWTRSWKPTIPDPSDPNQRVRTSALPLGILVTVTVLDSKTAEKLSGLTDSDDIERLISQGAVTMSRFIPLNRN